MRRASALLSLADGFKPRGEVGQVEPVVLGCSQ